MKKPIARVWTFRSDSSDREYETLQHTDGSTSCNCPGWTRRVAANGSRSCKHTRLVDQGRAESHAIAHHDYAKGTPAAVAVADTEAQALSSLLQAVAAGTRRFA